ncbi:MAG: hypothetical protein GX654_14535 [Desulfatiglans sp.]|jgi:hypothetical protein|nr:hypothetical protein [Desulfatiglans sp.]
MEIKREDKKFSVLQVVLCIAVVALIAVIINQRYRITLKCRRMFSSL